MLALVDHPFACYPSQHAFFFGSLSVCLFVCLFVCPATNRIRRFARVGRANRKMQAGPDKQNQSCGGTSSGTRSISLSTLARAIPVRLSGETGCVPYSCKLYHTKWLYPSIRTYLLLPIIVSISIHIICDVWTGACIHACITRCCLLVRSVKEGDVCCMYYPVYYCTVLHCTVLPPSSRCEDPCIPSRPDRGSHCHSHAHYIHTDRLQHDGDGMDGYILEDTTHSVASSIPNDTNGFP